MNKLFTVVATQVETFFGAFWVQKQSLGLFLIWRAERLLGQANLGGFNQPQKPTFAGAYRNARPNRAVWAAAQWCQRPPKRRLSFCTKAALLGAPRGAKTSPASPATLAPAHYQSTFPEARTTRAPPPTIECFQHPPKTALAPNKSKSSQNGQKN